jgi:hypothetical protein
MQARPNRTIPVRFALIFLASFSAYISPEDALAVRPFVTDDARIVYKGQLETETYAGMTMVKGDKPAIEARALQGMAFTDRFELIAGGFGFTYQDNQARPLDLLIQPKYVLHRSFGAIPSLSVAAATLFPLSGNRQHWDGYAMAHVSWFLFTPEDSTDPYDNDLAIHLNLGMKSRYDAGPVTYQSKLYWAAGFEVITPMNARYGSWEKFSTVIRLLLKKSFPLFKPAFAGTRVPRSSWTWSCEAYGTAPWKRKPRRVRSFLLAGTIRFRQAYVCYSMSSDNHTEFRSGTNSNGLSPRVWPASPLRLPPITPLLSRRTPMLGCHP